jgi:hypothetical protein
MHIGLGPSLGDAATMGGGVAPAYEAEATALFARMTTQPDVTRKGVINSTIAALKTASLWTPLRALYMTAAHEAATAMLNWRGDVYNLTAYGSPLFTVDKGFAGDGSGAYFDSGFAPSAAGQAANSNLLGVGVGTDRAAATTVTAGARVISSNITQIVPFAVGNAAYYRANSVTSLSKTGLTSSKSTNYVGRLPTDVETAYRNGVVVAQRSQGPAGAMTSRIFFLALSVVNVPSSYSTDTMWCGVIADGLTDANVATLDSILVTYGTTIGAI